MTDILVITGLSGAGRSEAADDLEDLGWFVVDNLPTSLIEKVAELGGGRGSSIDRLALVVGSGTHQADILEVIGRLRSAGHRVRVLFLEAATPRWSAATAARGASTRSPTAARACSTSSSRSGSCSSRCGPWPTW